MLNKIKRLFYRPKPIAVHINGFRDMMVYYDDTSYKMFDYLEAKQPNIPYETWKYTPKSRWYINEDLILDGLIRNYVNKETYPILAKDGTKFLFLYSNEHMEYPMLIDTNDKTSYIIDKTDDNIKFLEENGFFQR